ncbi:MAG TPA: anthranilate synthase component 1 [Allosphingosinicella sp.]|nr:anthranilate synthase component 1 [Allosphingosinicella sp.]
MSSQPPGAGEALALFRVLPDDMDALTLYAGLSDGGRRADTMLFERSVGPSLLLDRAAVRAECRGHEAVLTALSEGGHNLLVTVAERLAERVVARAPDRLVLHFPAPEGVDAEARLTAPSPFDAVRELVLRLKASDAEPFALCCLGVVAYDHVDLFETLPGPAEDPLGFPDFVFWLAESLIVFEPGARPRAVCTAFGSGDSGAATRAYFGAQERLADLVARCAKAPALAADAPPPGQPDFSQVDLDDADYEALVERMKGHIGDGDVYQIVPSRTFRSPCRDPLRAYAAIRALDRGPYQFFVSGHDHLLFGASPETSVRIFRDEGARQVEVKPIAGTRPRGDTRDEDDRLEAEMRLDHKELAEHMMLVDLARNDVARISAAGSRRVARLMTVERYARVMHLVSSVIGRLREDFDAFDALQACLNVGTLTGAPKLRATELLRGAERTKRGPYGGAVGWVNGEGLMDTSVVIRSAVVRDGIAYVRAGAGVVHDSDPRAEADETKRKASALLSVLAGVEAAA